MEVKHPEITVKLVGEDGNAFAILGRMVAEMQKAGISREEIDTFLDEAKSGDYDNLLQTCIKWVTVE